MKCNTVRIEDICTFVTSGGTPLTSVQSYYTPKEIPWLKTGEVNYCRIYNTEFYISKEGLERSSAKLIPANSVIVAMYGQGDTAGRVAINKIPLSTNQACCNLIINQEKADYEYVYYALCTLYERLVALKNGGAQPNLNAKIIKEIKIPLPELDIQHRIASVLAAYDELIDNNQKQIKLLEEAAQRLYKEWFVDLRFPGYEDVQIVDGVPAGWHKGTVQEIVKYHDTMRKPLSGQQREKMKGKYRYYGAAGVLDYVNKYIFDGTYLLLGEDGTVITNDGLPVLQYVTGQFWVNNHAHVLTGKGNYSTEFIFMMFSFMGISDVVTGVAQPKISQGRLSAKKVVIPSEGLAVLFHNNTKPIFDRVLLLEKQITLFSEARDRLLPKLMSGEIEL